MERVTAAKGAAAIGRVPFDHSFAVLASLWGYSSTELDVSLDEGVLAVYQSGAGSALLHFVSLDRVHAVATVQLWGAGDVTVVRDMLRRFERQQQVGRTCSYLFPWESGERAALESLGFAHEATLRQHVYARGSAQDLLVFGRLVASP